jgi:hypothetical protein
MPRGAALSVLVGDDWGDDDAALDDFLVMRVDVEESEARRENAEHCRAHHRSDHWFTAGERSAYTNRR